MDYLDLTKKDIEIEKRLLSVYHSAINSLPEGSLTLKKIKNNFYYYYIDPVTKRQRYMRHNEGSLIEQLKYRKMLTEAIQTLQQNVEIQESLLNQYKTYDPASLHHRLPKSYQDMPLSGYHEVLFDTPEKWAKRNYKKSRFTDSYKLKTTFGLWVRSKSEAIITELLHSYNIPFRYEAQLILYDHDGKKHIVYPDLSFITPVNYQLYWEHLGMLDRKDYRESNEKKFQLYFENDILVPNNLIITMDDIHGGLDVEGIHRIITNQLLPLFK